MLVRSRSWHVAVGGKQSASSGQFVDWCGNGHYTSNPASRTINHPDKKLVLPPRPMLNSTLVPHFSWSTGWDNTIDYDSLDASAVALAECIIRAGMQQLPNNPYMIILNSSFLIDVMGSYQSGYSELQMAKKADPRCEGNLPEKGRGGWRVLLKVKPASREFCITPTKLTLFLLFPLPSPQPPGTLCHLQPGAGAHPKTEWGSKRRERRRPGKCPLLSYPRFLIPV